MPKNPKSRPKIKHHVCTPYPFKLKSQAYPRCIICGRAMKLLPNTGEPTAIPEATPETKRICDEILQIFNESRGKVIVYKR